MCCNNSGTGNNLSAHQKKTGYDKCCFSLATQVHTVLRKMSQSYLFQHGKCPWNAHMKKANYVCLWAQTYLCLKISTDRSYSKPNQSKPNQRKQLCRSTEKNQKRCIKPKIFPWKEGDYCFLLCAHWYFLLNPIPREGQDPYLGRCSQWWGWTPSTQWSRRC